MFVLTMTADAPIDWGIDCGFYLLGVFASEQEANSKKAEFEEFGLPDDIRMRTSKDGVAYDQFEGEELSFQVRPISPLTYIGGACYVE